MQDFKQLDEKGQVLLRPTFNQCQDVFALLEADEEIAVVRAGLDALEVTQATQLIGRRKASSLYGCLPSRVACGYQLKISQAGISMSGLSARTKLLSPSARTRK